MLVHSFKLQIIGRVKNNINKRSDVSEWKNVKSQIILQKELEEALDSIEEFSHLFILFWIDQMPCVSSLVTKVIPYGLAHVGSIGIFATRVPCRPNPIGLSIVKLLARNGNILEVEGLDAFNNTPILDIKPYTGYPKDSVKNCKTPTWANT